MKVNSYNLAMASILNIAAYHFARIEQPAAVAQQLRESALARELLGTILVAPEGVNLFLAGEPTALRALLAEVRALPGCAALTVKESVSEHVPFRRLKVRVEREIITFDPSINPAQDVAPSVAPDVLARWIEQGHDDAGRELVLLDTRNEEEVAVGSFAGAVNPHIRKFTELPEVVLAQREAWADKTVVGFCTGGVRCEKFMPWMQRQGFAHVAQLEGGILNYFEKTGGKHWNGACFVFDERVGLKPDLTPLVDAPADGRV
jgi:UPF0176 protein